MSQEATGAWGVVWVTADPGTPHPTPLGRPSLGGQAIPTCPLPQVPPLLPRQTWAPQTHPPSENTEFQPFSFPSWGGAWGGGMPPESQEIFWKQSQIFLGLSNKSWSDFRKAFVPQSLCLPVCEAAQNGRGGHEAQVPEHAWSHPAPRRRPCGLSVSRRKRWSPASVYLCTPQV